MWPVAYEGLEIRKTSSYRSALNCRMTIHTHATIETPGVPHDWMLLRMVLVMHGMVLMELMHHAGRLRHATADAAGWVPSGSVLRFS